MNSVSRYPSTIYRVSLKAVIRNEKREVLVCKEYDSDKWSLPGGGWDHGETEHEALARELKEEVNYEGNFTSSPVATAVLWVESRNAWLLWIVYDVKTEHMNFGVGVDTSEVAFVSPEIFKKDKTPHGEWLVNFFKTN